MDRAQELVPEIKKIVGPKLSEQLGKALDDACMVMRNMSKCANDARTLSDARDQVSQDFIRRIDANFDSLLGSAAQSEVNLLDYSNLRLVEEGDLEAIIALEGMVAHARNTDISEYLAFSTRLNMLCHGIYIDESNNPMDPEQIGDAIREALQALGLGAESLLQIYRQFNSRVFHELESVLKEANALLIDEGVMADLDVMARSKEDMKNRRGGNRERVDPNERAFQGGDGQGKAMPQDMFAMMQNLMHRGQGGQSGQSNGQPVNQAASSGANPDYTGHVMPYLQPGMLVGGQKVEMLADEKLLALLNQVEIPAAQASQGQAPDLVAALGKLLEQQSQDGKFAAVDSKASDVINLITLLYEAIWDDATVQIPIKELIGRTQITTLKIALKDAEFFDKDDHPLRLLINELATAGIGWTAYERLENDPMYQKMFAVVEALVDQYNGETAYIEDLLSSFREFKQSQATGERELEQSLMDADERSQRLDDIKRYAYQKITERILDEQTSATVRRFLENQFHSFLVEVILREGPGGNSWKPIMNTIDVLLWTVQGDKTEADRERFKKLNGRLMLNLRRSMEVAGVEEDEAKTVIKAIQAAQKACLEQRPSEPEPEPADDSFEAWMQVAAAESSKQQEDLPADDEHLLEVDSYEPGIWMEFDIDDTHSIRCTLAAKIASIDKYVFVNDQGVKVIEKSRMGLARELKAGTVKVISASPLLDRAMETVIGRLRMDQAGDTATQSQ